MVKLLAESLTNSDIYLFIVKLLPLTPNWITVPTMRYNLLILHVVEVEKTKLCHFKSILKCTRK